MHQIHIHSPNTKNATPPSNILPTTPHRNAPQPRNDLVPLILSNPRPAPLPRLKIRPRRTPRSMRPPPAPGTRPVATKRALPAPRPVHTQIHPTPRLMAVAALFGRRGKLNEPLAVGRELKVVQHSPGGCKRENGGGAAARCGEGRAGGGGAHGADEEAACAGRAGGVPAGEGAADGEGGLASGADVVEGLGWGGAGGGGRGWGEEA